MDIDALWGKEEPENTVTKKRRKPAKPAKPAKPLKTEDTSVGFRMQLGTCHRRGKKGEIVEAPILLAKDPLCWILRIGSHQTYPSTLAGVFAEISQADALQLKNNADIHDLIQSQKDLEERIQEMGRVLDKRIKTYIQKYSKKRKS